MIVTQQIKSISTKPVDYKDFITINALKWDKSKYKELCPYYLCTDGKERNKNPGGVLFENFYQGSKIYDTVYENKVYPSRFQSGDPKYLMWHYQPVSAQGDRLIYDEENNEDGDENVKIDYELYFRWRDSLWACDKPIRYPNKIQNRKNTQFALSIDANNVEKRMDYLTARKEIYAFEYIRLVKNLPIYRTLLAYLRMGKNLLICEIDVPATGKKGIYGQDCDDNNSCLISLEKLELLLNDPSEAFGHGLCLAYALLEDNIS